MSNFELEPSPPGENEWDPESLARVFDSLDPSALLSALLTSDRGRDALFLLGDRAIVPLAGLGASLSVFRAVIIVLVKQIERLDVFEDLESAILAILRFDPDPLLDLVGRLLIEIPEVIDNVSTLIKLLRENVETIAQDLNNFLQMELLSPRALERLENIIKQTEKAVNAQIGE